MVTLLLVSAIRFSYFVLSLMDAGSGSSSAAEARYPFHSASKGCCSGLVHCSCPVPMEVMAENIICRTSSSGGASSFTLLTQILPLTPGSLQVNRCSFPMGVGVEFGPSMSRRMLMVTSVLRSHFELVGDMERECHSAVLSSRGVFGSSSFTSAEGEASILAVVGSRCGCVGNHTRNQGCYEIENQNVTSLWKQSMCNVLLSHEYRAKGN